jgi:hypothetical protein
MHFVESSDIQWMLQLTASRVHIANAYMYRKMELDTAVLNKCIDIIIKELRDGKQLTRLDINKKFKENNIEAEGHRLSYIMMYAELEGIICSGKRVGNQFTYALLEERTKACKKKTREESLVELSLRYFSSRGPATINDFSVWSGLTLTDCRKGVEMIESQLSYVPINNEQYYFVENGFFNGPVNKSIKLLSIYDEYIMGYKNRDDIFQFRNSLKPVPTVQFDNMILSKGQIIGCWKRIVTSKNIQIICSLFKKQSKSVLMELEKNAESLENFHEMKCILSIL